MSKRHPKRFYKEVDTTEVDGAFHVLLDGRTLKTPGKATLVAPTLRVAECVASEWNAQQEHIRPETMPVTRLLNVAIELTPNNRPKLLDEARSYASTDLLCYRDAPSALSRHQAENWDPVLLWAKDRGIELRAEASILAIEQTPSSLDMVREFADTLDDLSLTLFVHFTAVFGSAILALAVMENHLTGSRAFELSRLDSNWQIAHWGEDEEAKEAADAVAIEVKALCKILGDEYV